MHMRGNKAHRVNLIAASDTQSLRNNCTHTPPLILSAQRQNRVKKRTPTPFHVRWRRSVLLSTSLKQNAV